jgi:hypothetical protein
VAVRAASTKGTTGTSARRHRALRTRGARPGPRRRHGTGAIARTATRRSAVVPTCPPRSDRPAPAMRRRCRRPRRRPPRPAMPSRSMERRGPPKFRGRRWASAMCGPVGQAGATGSTTTGVETRRARRPAQRSPDTPPAPREPGHLSVPQLSRAPAPPDGSAAVRAVHLQTALGPPSVTPTRRRAGRGAAGRREAEGRADRPSSADPPSIPVGRPGSTAHRSLAPSRRPTASADRLPRRRVSS